MSIAVEKLMRRLRKKYKTATEAAEALGLDAAMPDPDDLTDVEVVEIIRRLIPRLDADGAAEVAEMLNAVMGEDEPPPFSGRPRPGGSADPVENARAELAARGRADWDPDTGAADAPRRPGAAVGRLARDRRRRIAADALPHGIKSFETRHPNAARVRIFGS